MRKVTGSYRTYLFLVKLQPWFLNLQWKTFSWAEYSDDDDDDANIKFEENKTYVYKSFENKF